MARARKVGAPAACLISAVLFGCNVAVAQSNPAPLDAPGTGIKSAYVPDCVPISGTDFIDGISWDLRMLEPRDCTLVRSGTPVFSWRLPVDMAKDGPMTLVVSRVDGRMLPLTRVSTTPRLLLAAAPGTEAPLESGQYEWYVSYTNTGGNTVQSHARRFTVADQENLLALPEGASFAHRIAQKRRPRTLPDGASFASIYSTIKGGSLAPGREYVPAYDALIRVAEAKKNLVAVMRNETIPAGTSNATYLKNGLDLATAERKLIETMGYAWHFTGKQEYRNTAIAHLTKLAEWQTDGSTGELQQDQANREVILGLALGLDLLQTELSTQQRVAIVASLRDRLNQTMAKFKGFDATPNDSHLVTAVGYTTEALMYAAGTPEFSCTTAFPCADGVLSAEAMLEKSWNTYITMLGAWSGSVDGGYANGSAYGWYTMTHRTRIVAALRLIGNLDLTPLPTVGNFGDNQIAFTAPDIALRSQFGDELELTQHYTNYSYDDYRLYASVTGKPEHEWYWRVNASNVLKDAPLQPMHFMLLGLRIPHAPASQPDLPDSWVFEDAGLVAMHSSTKEPSRSSVFFRSSRFSGNNHSHADNNAFTFVSHGQPMLISGGYYPFFNSPHHALVARATRFKNALTFNGGVGQSEQFSTLTPQSLPGKPSFSMNTRGQIINFADNGTWAVTTGDATLAYRGKAPNATLYTPFLSNAIRSVAYHREQGVVVIYDWATSTEEKLWELNFQTLKQPQLNGKTLRLSMAEINACLDIRLDGAPGAFAFTSGFPAEPRLDNADKTYAQQYQSRYSVASPSKELVSVTVIREDCNDVDVKVDFDGTSASVAIGGAAPLVFDRKTIKSQ